MNSRSRGCAGRRGPGYHEVPAPTRVDFDDRAPAAGEVDLNSDSRFVWDRMCREQQLDSETYLGSRV
jgi:hypothetical protein